MQQTNDEMTRHVAERWCWQIARRDDARIARRLYRTQVVDGGYRLDEGAVLDDCFHFLERVGVMALRAEVHGAGIQRAMLPFIQDVLRYSLKPLLGIERIKALPALLCSDEPLMPWVGFHAHEVRNGVCQRGAATRQGERQPGPICPDTLAKHVVKWDVRPLEAVCNGAIRALAQAQVFGKQVNGMADGTALETTEHDRGCGQATRQVRLEAKHGHRHEMEVTVYGWNVLRLIDATTKIPLAVKVAPTQAHETHWTRALVTQARAHLAGAACLHQVVFEQGFWDGTALWWLDQQGLRFIAPAKATMAVTADARAPAAAGEGLTMGRRVHTGRHGQGQAAATERLAMEVVGLTALTTDDQDGTPEHGRVHHRRAYQATPIHAVVVRTWHGREYGPEGKPVFLTHASVANPVQPFDDDDDRSRIENCCIKAATQPWDLGPPPRTPSGRCGYVLCTRLMWALATASRRPCAREATGGEPVGWQRWRRQLRAHPRDKVLGGVQGHDGIFHLAEYPLLLGVRLQDKPPGIGTSPDMLVKDRLTSCRLERYVGISLQG